MLHILVPYDMNFDVVSKRLTVSLQDLAGRSEIWSGFPRP
jgi:hypothetical protein